MANKILTPVTLWSDFDDSLPPTETVLREWEENGAVFSAIRYQGRETEAGRVDIFALFAKPKEPENCPVLLVLPDAGQTADEELLRFFVAKGYAVLMPDYRGAWANTEEYTVYPQCVAYANYAQAGLHLDYAEPSAKETSWYEWVAVARYSAQYLAARFPSSKLGAVGIKAGGETALMLAGTYGKLSCAILVCAGGWRAYRGVHKFGDNAAELKMNDERHRFLAGADAQAYAQYAKCPVLMLCSTNDERFDADRAFDTFARINPEMDKTFYFAARYDGCIGKTGQNDLFLFLDKYLKEREVFIPSPAEVSIEEDGGELAARVKFDKNGEVTYCEVFMAEDNPDSASRDWTKCALKREDGEDEQIFNLSAYEGASRVFVFAKTKYSCGFAVSSKIAVKRLEKSYPNSLRKSRILYSSEDGYGSFVIDRPGESAVAETFLSGKGSPVCLKEGPCGIKGIYSPYGLRLFRINDVRFRPGDNALIKFDLYNAEPATLTVCICTEKNGEKEEFVCNLRLSGGERWTDHVLAPKDFKSGENKPLAQFAGARYISFSSANEVFINNLICI